MSQIVDYNKFGLNVRYWEPESMFRDDYMVSLICSRQDSVPKKFLVVISPLINCGVSEGCEYISLRKNIEFLEDCSFI